MQEIGARAQEAFREWRQPHLLQVCPLPTWVRAAGNVERYLFQDDWIAIAEILLADCSASKIADEPRVKQCLTIAHQTLSPLGID
ncbi:hypothetical protein [Streptomyces sp. NPDC020951]|uniref:hypothetical protein n=1 Tax=Streptomyces sp. NPDC020951 TaxID=3365104 RepID=UPI0037AC5C69